MLRLLCTLEGEVVRDIKPIIGYLHTGIEKSMEDQQYWKAITFVERMDYLAYYSNAMSYCNAVENLLEEEVPKKAQYLRVIHLELNRIASHLFWLATAALDIGAITMLWWGCRERDYVLDLFEMSSGQRMHTRYFQVGGVFEDIPPGLEKKCREFLELFPARLDQYEALLDRNEIWLQRMRNVGVVSKERLNEFGVTGPLLRAAGDPWDLRKAMPYSSYEDFDFKIPVGTIGDCFDRYRVRMAEMRESREDRRAGARRHARGPVHHHQPQGRAAAAARARDLDGGADPPLQARHRGLPRARRRGLRPGRVAARRDRLLHPRRRLGQARPGAHPRPQLHQPAGAARTWARTA